MFFGIVKGNNHFKLITMIVIGWLISLWTIVLFGINTEGGWMYFGLIATFVVLTIIAIILLIMSDDWARDITFDMQEKYRIYLQTQTNKKG